MIKMNQQKITLAVWVTWVHHSDIPVAKSLTIHPASWQARCMSLILCYARETFENRWNVMDCTHQSSCGCGMLWMWSWYTPGFVFSTTVSRLQPGVSLVSFKSKTSTFNAARKHIGNVRKPWIDNLFQNLSHSHHHAVCVCVCLGLCNAVKSTLGDFLYPIHLPAPQTRTRNVRLRSKMMIPSNIPRTNDDPFCSIQHPKRPAVGWFKLITAATASSKTTQIYPPSYNVPPQATTTTTKKAWFPWIPIHIKGNFSSTKKQNTEHNYHTWFANHAKQRHTLPETNSQSTWKLIGFQGFLAVSIEGRYSPPNF